MKKIKVALIGFGRQGKQHFDALKTIAHAKNIEIVGICDVIPQGVKSVPFFTEYKELFKKAAPNVVIISVPNNLHKEITLYALQQSCDVIKEKPLAINYSDGEEIITKAKELHRVVITTQQRYFSPIFLEAKNVLRYIGTPKKFSYSFTLNDSQKSWYWDVKQSGGGSWLNIGWHGISTLMWLLGDITDVKLTSNSGGKREWDYQTDHSSLAKIKIGNIQGTAFFSCIYPKEEKLLIIGDRGKLYLDRGQLQVSSLETVIDTPIVNDEKNTYVSQMNSLFEALSQKTYVMEKDLKVLKIIQMGIDSLAKGEHARAT